MFLLNIVKYSLYSQYSEFIKNLDLIEYSVCRDVNPYRLVNISDTKEFRDF